MNIVCRKKSKQEAGEVKKLYKVSLSEPTRVKCSESTDSQSSEVTQAVEVDEILRDTKHLIETLNTVENMYNSLSFVESNL